MHKRHLMNVEHVRRHLALSDECGICHNGSEDIDHVLWFCIKACELLGKCWKRARCCNILDEDRAMRESVFDRDKRRAEMETDNKEATSTIDHSSMTPASSDALVPQQRMAVLML
ncbi:hypothetical protein V6N11_002862 [Hibiscus sabdariffa]|uniref:Reverse transcriptase zinc-binding domain-containing protein n=1 Tax=Hibiscus sabdariffa TaxID=183260 RepID=A0ABR2SBI3_9ROSI